MELRSDGTLRPGHGEGRIREKMTPKKKKISRQIWQNTSGLLLASGQRGTHEINGINKLSERKKNTFQTLFSILFLIGIHALCASMKCATLHIRRLADTHTKKIGEKNVSSTWTHHSTLGQNRMNKTSAVVVNIVWCRTSAAPQRCRAHGHAVIQMPTHTAHAGAKDTRTQE